MLWHVSCCIWLMVVLVLSSDQLTKSTESDFLNKPKFRFNEVADFADVVEPTEEEPKEIDREKKNVEQELVRNIREQEEDGSTLRVALEVNGDYSATNKFVDLSLEGKEDSNIVNQHKRSIPKKYTNLLDLKYYYSKGVPIRGHLIGNVQNEKNGKRKRDVKTVQNFFSSGSVQKNKFKRNTLNIIPIMAETNPYISKLADATNDAYLKMRNYAATLMLILTTPRTHSVSNSFEGKQYNSILKQRVKKCTDSTPIKKDTNNDPITFPVLQPSSPVPYVSQIPYTFAAPQLSSIPIRILLPSKTTSQRLKSTEERKPTTISPLAWEAGLLKEANIKLRRDILDKMSASNENEEQPDDRITLVPLAQNHSSNLEISNKILTPPVPVVDAPCILNKAKDPGEECDDMNDYEEDCSIQGNGTQCNLSINGNPTNKAEKKDERDVSNTPMGSDSQSQEQGDAIATCKQYYVVSAKDIQQGVTQAVQNLVAPEKKLTDIKPYKTGAAHESDNDCVKKLLLKPPTPESDFEFPTMTLNLNSMVAKIAKCPKQSANSTNDAGASTNPSLTNGENLQSDTKPAVMTETTTECTTTTKGVKGNSGSAAKSSKAHVSTRLSENGSSIEEEYQNNEQTTAKLMEIQENYDVNADYPVNELHRLQRDLFVVTQLEQLLEKLTGGNKIRNFRDDQNSQYDDNFEDDNEMISSYENQKKTNDENQIIPNDSLNINKRGLFRKKKRKKKKAKNVWKHIFGIHSEDNRFLNQNFPNSQYAKYPI